MSRPLLLFAGRTSYSGKWHLLKQRDAFRPWPYDRVYPTTPYPICGAVPVFYTDRPVIKLGPRQQVNCRRCLRRAMWGWRVLVALSSRA